MAERGRLRSLDELLVDERLLDGEALREARRTALRLHVQLVEVLVDEHLVDEVRIAELLCHRLRLPRARVTTIELEAVHELPHDLAAAH